MAIRIYKKRRLKRYRTFQLAWEIKVRNMKRAESAARIKALREQGRVLNELTWNEHQGVPPAILAKMIAERVRRVAMPRAEGESKEAYWERLRLTVNTLGPAVLSCLDKEAGPYAKPSRSDGA
jgi:hypothetical protein